MKHPRPLLTTAAAWLGLAGLGVILSGCGGGATAATTVKFRPSSPGSATSEVVAEAGTTDAGGAAAPGGVGSLKGRILYSGTFSPLPPLYAKGSASKDNEVCGMQAAPNETVVVNDGGLANVFLWLEKVPKGAEIPASPNEAAVFDQKFCVFMPHAMIVRTNQTLRILNSDTVAHNTSMSPDRNQLFNAAVSGNTETQLVYKKPEKKPIQVRCDIHPWMTAYHLPLEHPFAAVSGPDGTFEIPQLPAGKLEFRVWHESGRDLEKALKIDIKPGEPTTFEYTVSASKLSQ